MNKLSRFRQFSLGRHPAPLGIALLYASFAALWIIASSTFLSVTIDDPLLQNRFELIKGLLFVAVTTGLLYLLLRAWIDPLLATSPKMHSMPVSGGRRLILLFLAFLMIVPLVGYSFLKLYGPPTERQAFANLQAVADLKAAHIENWLAERELAAMRMLATEQFIRQVTQMQSPNAFQARAEVRSYLEAIRLAHGYRTVTLLGADGRELISTGDQGTMKPRIGSRLTTAFASGRVQRGELSLDDQGKAHMDFIVPLLNPKRAQSAIGAVTLHFDPDLFLANFLEYWPEALFSGETQLVRRSGNSVLFFNQASQEANGIKLTQYPYTDISNPVVAAIASGMPGTMQGVDYDGMPVLAAYRPVKGTDWHIVAKLDRKEALEPLHDLAFWISAVTFFALVAIGAALLLLWRTQQRAHQLAIALREEQLLGNFYSLPFIGMAIASPGMKSWLKFNDRLCEILGYSHNELTQKGWHEIAHPDDLGKDKAELARIENKESEGYILDQRLVRNDGATVHAAVNVRCVRKIGGEVDFLVVTIQDITERKRTDEQLQLAAKVFEQSGEGIIMVDAGNRIVMVNQAFTTISGYSETDVLGKNPRLLSSGSHSSGFYRAMWDAISQHGRWQGELWNRKKNGIVYPEWLSISQAHDPQGKLTHYIGIFSDLTHYKAAEEHMHRLTHFDSLTGLPNRAMLSDRCSHALGMAQRNAESLALMFIDLDHFKNVNDSLGHRIGDALVVQFAQRLATLVRAQDTLSRVGGDEFILLLPGTDIEEAARLAEKLTHATVQHYQIEQHELSITASIGIVIYPGDGNDFDSLSRSAEVAMYRAKQNGHNVFCFFTPEMQSRSARNLTLENALRRALERNELTLHYQPQVSLSDNRILGVEALLRWTHPQFGMVSPAEFIPIAESSGLILSIGEWVLRTAAKQLKSWLDKGFAPMTMSVNLSAVQFRHPSLSELVMRILDETNLPAHHLELELTEGAAMENPVAAIAVMDRLNGNGIRLSIDDFGVGHSSLGYLKRFKVNKLKIDRSFVRDIPDDAEDMALVSAIISLADGLGLKVIAEGVETENQLDFLRDRGCNEIQGYYFSPALAADQLETFLLGWKSELVVS